VIAPGEHHRNGLLVVRQSWDLPVLSWCRAVQVHLPDATNVRCGAVVSGARSQGLCNSGRASGATGMNMVPEL